MKFFSLIPILIALPISAFPLNATTIQTNSFTFDGLSGREVRPKIFPVSNYKQLATKYRHLLQRVRKEEQNIVFHLSDTKTYLTLSKKKIIDESLDNVGVKSMGWWWDKESQTEVPEEYWVEFDPGNAKISKHPGIVPVSACQKQNANSTGSISFDFSFSNSVGQQHTLESSFGLTIPMFSLTLAANYKMAISAPETTTIGGSISCSLKSGQTGQVYLEPMSIEIAAKSRLVKFDDVRANFEILTDYESFDAVSALLDPSSYQVHCVTDDIVNLYCAEKLGEPNWEHPLQIIETD